MLSLLMGGALLQFPFGGCDFGEISTTVTTTLDGRDVIVSLFRAAVITPLDMLLTNAVNNFIDNLEEDD